MKTRKKILILTITLSLALLLFWPVSAVIGGNPPSGTSYVTMGPAITGDLIVTEEGDGIRIVFDGNCKGDFEIEAPIPSVGYDAVTEEYMADNPFISASSITSVQPECVNQKGSSQLEIKVLKFEEFESPAYKKIQLLMLFVVDK